MAKPPRIKIGDKEITGFKEPMEFLSEGVEISFKAKYDPIGTGLEPGEKSKFKFYREDGKYFEGMAEKIGEEIKDGECNETFRAIGKLILKS